MTEANEMFDTIIMRELNSLVISDTEETKEELELDRVTCPEADDIPLSLLSYFESSRSRAAVCEKIFQIPECFTAHQKNTSTDPRLPPEATQRDAILTQNSSECPNNEDEAGTDGCAAREKLLAPEERCPETRLSEEGRKENREREAEGEKRHREEDTRREEERRRIEVDFQEELRRIVEAEKLHQKELELMAKKAQDTLEQEMLLQQEVISDLQKRVTEERKMLEEEQKKRLRDEEDKRKKEEEKIKMEAEKKRMEEEMKRKKEEEMKVKKEKEDEEKKRMEMEARKRDSEKRRVEVEMRMRKEEEMRKMAEEMRLNEERQNRKDEDMRREEERRIYQQVEERKKQEINKNKRWEKGKRERRRHENVDEEIKLEEGRNTKSQRMEVKERVVEVDKKEEHNRKRNEAIAEDEKRDEGGENETKEGQMRQWDKKESRKSKEVQLNGDNVTHAVYVMDNRQMSKTTYEQLQNEKMTQRKDLGTEMEQNSDNGENKVDIKKEPEEEFIFNHKKISEKTLDTEIELSVVRANEPREKRENSDIVGENESMNRGDTENSMAQHRKPTVSPENTETPQQKDPANSQASTNETADCVNQTPRPSPTESAVLPVCLPDRTEQKRLSWMRDCVSWSKLSLQNRRKQTGSVGGKRGVRRVAEATNLPPLCPDTVLQSAHCRSLKEVTTVTLQDLPGCSLSTLAQCTNLQSLTLRRCGLKSLEGLKQLPQLCYVDVQENEISYVDCENMASLRVLHLAHNNLTSIHGLTGAENVDVLDLSHNSITRIAGLEPMKRLQRLSVDHNQLISTKGLKDVYTLVHLDCSHNHLASAEGLENCALLNTLDLSANSLSEPPTLDNQVLLRELRLDDNSISSLQGLAACWLPLMQHLSVAQNRITQLPSMSDFVSLANLDLRYNCLSELQDLCESLEGLGLLRGIHLTGNPLQRESGWRSTLQKAVPVLRVIDDQKTDSFPSAPAPQRASFLKLCQDQLQQTADLQQRHCRKLSDASSSLDVLGTSCRHFAEVLQLAQDQRFAHEYGDTAVADKRPLAPEEMVNTDSTNAEKSPEIESDEKVPPPTSNRDNTRRRNRTFEEMPATEIRRDTLGAVTPGQTRDPTVSRANPGSVGVLATEGETTSSDVKPMPVSNHQNPDPQNTAAVVIQQLWRKHRQKCGNVGSPSAAVKGGDGDEPDSGPSYVNRSFAREHYAATVIQALWRGFSLRRRLRWALSAVEGPDSGEDDTLEEVDVEEFVLDEEALDKSWTLPLSEDPPPRCYLAPEHSVSLKSSSIVTFEHTKTNTQPPELFPEPSQCVLPPQLVRRSKQAWVAGDQVDSIGQTVYPFVSHRCKSPPPNTSRSALSEKSEKIQEEWGFAHSRTALQMLKRAKKMTSNKQQQNKLKDPSVRLALFRKCSNQQGPVEARTRHAQHNINNRKACEAEQGPQTERETGHTHAFQADSESARFLPEIGSDILNGGRVQLVANPGYPERLHHASGPGANSSLAAQPSKENHYLRRNSLGHARKEVPSAKRASSSPSKRERMSFRDNPLQRSGGWGGGKKRDRVHK